MKNKVISIFVLVFFSPLLLLSQGYGRGRNFSDNGRLGLPSIDEVFSSVIISIVCFTIYFLLIKRKTKSDNLGWLIIISFLVGIIFAIPLLVWLFEIGKVLLIIGSIGIFTFFIVRDLIKRTN